MADILLITPPFTQLNTPYPATAYLTGFLQAKGFSVSQRDLGMEVILAIFSENGLRELFMNAADRLEFADENTERVFILQTDYINSVDPVIAFLQGKNPELARTICAGNFLPEGKRFADLDYLDWAFGEMGIYDKAKHLATLYLEDLSDFIRDVVDPNFGVSRYAEHLGHSANSFEPLYSYLQTDPTYIDRITLQILERHIRDEEPKFVGVSVPFPGNLASAFRCGQFLKKEFPSIRIAMGGGFPNTELRSLRDKRVFEFFDHITLDDGELPIELLAQHILNQKDAVLKRTWHLESGELHFNDLSLRKDYKQHELNAPSYAGLDLSSYLSVIEVANPMHSLWNNGRWLKLTMAHGCYWGKCTFCDVSLDYIQNYQPVAASLLVDHMEKLIAETGERGFHFVDEAAPPALMRDVALEIIRRKIVVTWWTNIRFEKSFTMDLCRLLRASGCVAVSGGLEVASDRLLQLIEKGVTVEQVAQVTRNFTDAGIMVHAYLMYGYPTQTVQETVDSLEMVRQMFEAGVLQSAFWHQFSLTAHSPIGRDPDRYGIMPILPEVTFAHNDIDFEDQTGIDHELFSEGLRKSLYNFMHGIGFDIPVHEWFEEQVPRTSIKPDYIAECLDHSASANCRDSSKLVLIGVGVIFHEEVDGVLTVTFHNRQASMDMQVSVELAAWMQRVFERCSPDASDPLTFGQFRAEFEEEFHGFEEFWASEEMEDLRSIGLLVLN
ncbi:MAG: radical SAM protein [Flavobacteriales bacterium]|nr:radical SAM protein [Flavobacteriales bacterium]